MPATTPLPTLWHTLLTRYGDSSPMVLLQLGEQHVQFTYSVPESPLPGTTTAPIGSTTLFQRYFSPRPTPASLEVAIMEVEDALAPLRAQLPLAGQLYSAEPGLLPIALATGWSTDGMDAPPLSATAVEQLFQRYCQFVEGGAALRQQWPETSPAALLILRELMHHLAFAEIHIVDGAMT